MTHCAPISSDDAGDESQRYTNLLSITLFLVTIVRFTFLTLIAAAFLILGPQISSAQKPPPNAADRATGADDHALAEKFRHDKRQGASAHSREKEMAVIKNTSKGESAKPADGSLPFK
ncbi:hypothetical protein BCR43DRAFT_508870 [Syncephalastrum racemosum]|uniref:Uncharacterized protein n=1 Tax=Syncephalastrum racemosum TaxID=13706 RepID=A0A1X2GZU7_SYNRA|nr:hypothetical protein BCR43DRAFT_508870 [Syncephalastrum racemosum]